MSSVAAVLAASRDDAADSSLLKCRAQRLAGMLHKLHFPEAETQEDLLHDVLAAHPLPAVALLCLLSEALDTRGVDAQDRLRPVTTLLQSHLQQPQEQAQEQAQQQQLFSRQDLSHALLAAVALLPELVEDSPKAPGVLGEAIGTLMGAGCLHDCGLRELAAAVAAAGLGPDDTVGSDGLCDNDGEQPPLVDQGVAAPVLLAAANGIKAVAGEAAARNAWEAAGGADLLDKLLPDWAKEPADVQELIARHEAAYLIGGG